MNPVACPRCRKTLAENAKFCPRCGLATAAIPEVAGSGKRPRRRWYQIGRLGAGRSAWANFLLVNLGFLAWLLWTDKPPDVGRFAGGFLGSILVYFGLCGAFGWIASGLAWRLLRKSQPATMVGFVLGAAGIFSMALLGNARIDRAQAGAAPSVNHDPFADLPSAASAPHFDAFDEGEMQTLIDGTDKWPVTKEWRDELAHGYLTGTMPDGLVKLYEQAINRRLLPDPRIGFKSDPKIGWKGDPIVKRWERIDELLHQAPIPLPPPGFVLDPAPQAPATPNPASDDPFTPSSLTTSLPPAAPPAPTEIDLSSTEVQKLKGILRRTGNYDPTNPVMDLQQPPGWVLSSIVVRITPVGDPETVGLPRTVFGRRYIPLAGDQGAEHFVLSNACLGYTQYTWRVVSAEGHRVEGRGTASDSALPAGGTRDAGDHKQVVEAVSNLHLQSIVQGGKYRACMINNTLYREGQQVGIFTLQKVGDGAVVVESGRYRFELRMAN